MDTDDELRATLDNLTPGFEQIAAARQLAQAAGQPMPDELRREIYAMREMLRERASISAGVHWSIGTSLMAAGAPR